MTPIADLRPHLKKTVRVRVLNAITISGIKHVEDLVGMDDLQLYCLGGMTGRLGEVSVKSLKRAVVVVMSKEGWCTQCGYNGSGEPILVEDDEKLCVRCAASTIRALKKPRFQLADALGHNQYTEPPAFKPLVKEVKKLIEMRSTLNEFRRFMKEEE